MRCLFVVLFCGLLLGAAGDVRADFAFSNVFAGRWGGTLESLDSQSGKRVSTPTTLMIQSTPDGTALIYHYLYDDSPGKQVQETETVAIDSAFATYSVLAGSEKMPTVYYVTGLPNFVRDQRGVLVLNGSGKDGDKTVDVRKTIWVMGGLTILTETRPPDGTFQFRSRYALTHLLMPQVSPGSGPAWRKAQEDALCEATFRYLLVAFPPDNGWRPKVYYLAMQSFPWDQETESDKASDAVFLKRFRGSTPPVENVFALIRNKDWKKQTRHQWIIYGVGHDIDWAGDTVIYIDAGRTVSGYDSRSYRGGRGIVLMCTLRNGWWEISTVAAPDSQYRAL